VDLEAESFLLDNVFREVDGLEVEIISEKKASKCFETIVNVSNQLHLRGFIHRLCLALGSEDNEYANLCRNPYASHVMECVFMRIAVTEPHGEGVVRDTQGVKMENISTLVLNWLRHMGADLLGMSSDKSASHVLRAMMLLFSGCRWGTKASQNAFSLKKNQLHGGGIIERDAATLLPWMTEAFATVVESFIKSLEGSVEDTKYFSSQEPASCATLQLLLVVCDLKNPVYRDRLVCALTFLPPPKSKQVVAPETSLFDELIYNGVGSRLAEVLLERCCDVHFQTLWENFVVPGARAMAMDHSANFALQTALIRAGSIPGCPMIPVLEAICRPNLAALFKGNRLGVVLQVMKAIRCLEEPSAASLWRRKIVALLSQSEVAAPLLVQLLGPIEDAGSGISRPLIDISSAIHGLGKEGTGVVDNFWDGLTEDQVRTACCCRAWSEVGEAFLKGDSSLASKNKFIRKMQINFVEMCRDKYGHHIALTALEVIELENAETYKGLSTMLKKNRDYICRNEWGTKLMKKLGDRSEQKYVPAAAPLTVESLFADDSSSSKKKRGRGGEEGNDVYSNDNNNGDDDGQDESKKKKKKKKKKKEKK
jgi:hypothetical protein